MYTPEERKRAIELYLRYDNSIAAVINELGYPSRQMLYKWYDDYLAQERNGVSQYTGGNLSKYSEEQKRVAVEYYCEHGRSKVRTIKALGYPGKDLLCEWINELSPDPYKGAGSMIKCTDEQKREAVVELCSSRKTVKAVAQEYGVGQSTVQRWKDKLIGKNKGTEIPNNTRREYPDDKDALVAELESLKTQINRLSLERDILEGTVAILKKDPGIDPYDLTNQEKAILIGALRETHRLGDLFPLLGIARSSYFYHRHVMALPDKNEVLRIRIRSIFDNSERRYGYRRVHAMLTREGVVVSEKVILRIMKEDGLIVVSKKARKYNSYQGEITPAVENLLERDFHADKPNQKWLTDITEFNIPAGKVYLSPVIDCFDGLAVSWTIGTSPDADLVNDMLDLAANTINAADHPLVHSDCGAHYRWPGWIARMDKYGFHRSMSKKGCTPDNSACEGFFGRLKNEMFYMRSWKDVSIDNFINSLNLYIQWYNDERIKMSLGAMSPREYRIRLGYVA